MSKLSIEQLINKYNVTEEKAVAESADPIGDVIAAHESAPDLSLVSSNPDDFSQSDCDNSIGSIISSLSGDESINPNDLPDLNLDIAMPDALPKLSDMAVLCDLTTKMWSNRRSDRKMKNQVAKENNAHSDMINVSKKLLKSDTLDQIASLANNEARAQVHYVLSSPWGDNGWRMLPAQNIPAYEEQMSEKRSEFYALRDKFCLEYAVLREEARGLLGNAFDPRVYPSVERVRDRFSFEYTLMPVPDTGNWQLAMEADRKTVAESRYRDFYKNQIMESVRERWDAAYRKVIWIIDKLTDGPDGKVKYFKGPSLDNAIEIIGMLDTFNLTGDETLTNVAAELRDTLRNVDGTSLRESEALRRQTRQRLEKAMADLPALF